MGGMRSVLEDLNKDLDARIARYGRSSMGCIIWRLGSMGNDAFTVLRG